MPGPWLDTSINAASLNFGGLVMFINGGVRILAVTDNRQTRPSFQPSCKNIRDLYHDNVHFIDPASISVGEAVGSWSGEVGWSPYRSRRKSTAFAGDLVRIMSDGS